MLLCPAIILSAAITVYAIGPLVPQAYPALDNALAQMLAGQLKGKVLKRSLTLSLAETYQLSWLYVSDITGNPNPSLEFAPITPALPGAGNMSRHVTYRDKPYYDAVAPIDGDHYLHAGVRLGPSMSSSAEYAVTNPLLLAFLPMRGMMVIFTLLIATALLEILLLIFVTRPIAALRLGISRMTRDGSIDLDSYDSIELPAAKISEVQELRLAMRAIFVYLQKIKKEALDEQEKFVKWKRQQSDVEQSTPQVRQTYIGGDTIGDSAGLSAFIDAHRSTESYAEEMVRSVQARLAQSIKGVVFVRAGFRDQHENVIQSTSEVGSQLRSQLAATDLGPLLSQARLTGNVVDLGPLRLKSFSLEEVLSRVGIRHVIVVPIIHRSTALAFLLVLAPQSLSQGDLSTLQQIVGRSASFYFGLLLGEDQEEKKWIDPLTGLRSRAFMNELLNHLASDQLASGKGEFALATFCLTIEGGDEQESLLLFDKAAMALRQMHDRKKSATGGGAGQEGLQFDVVRGQQEFMIIARGAERDAYKALCHSIADELSPLLKESTRPAKLSLGLACFPSSCSTVESLVSRSRVAMSFAEEHGTPPVSLLKAEAVPADFRPAKRVRALKGELGVLDGPELIQSIAGANRTGVLTVEDGFGKQFSLTMVAGRPVEAKLGKLSDADALVEFFVTFNGGSFNFKEMDIDESVGSSLPPLMNILMEGAMAADHYQVAKDILIGLDRPVRFGVNINSWTESLDMNEVTKREYATMQEILGLVDGAASLDKIFARMEATPTHLRWRGAALLQSCGAIELKTLP